MHACVYTYLQYICTYVYTVVIYMHVTLQAKYFILEQIRHFCMNELQVLKTKIFCVCLGFTSNKAKFIHDSTNGQVNRASSMPYACPVNPSFSCGRRVQISFIQ